MSVDGSIMPDMAGPSRAMGKAAAGITAAGLMLAGTATPSAGSPRQGACNTAVFTHNSESRVTGDVRYWFPNTSWTACDGPGGLIQTRMEGANPGFQAGAGRGYYHAGGGNWTFAQRTVKFEAANAGLQLIISDLRTTTRFNHGYTVSGVRMSSSGH